MIWGNNKHPYGPVGIVLSAFGITKLAPIHARYVLSKVYMLSPNPGLLLVDGGFAAFEIGGNGGEHLTYYPSPYTVIYRTLFPGSSPYAEYWVNTSGCKRLRVKLFFPENTNFM